eukprot:XP_001691853.1 predicted protein [Chlamydomonas reinhardtii]
MARTLSAAAGDPAALHPSRPAVGKGSALKGGDGKPSWLSKLTKTKAAALEAVKDKLASGRYLEPMSQEQVGGRVEDSLGGSLEPFGNFQGALHDIMEAVDRGRELGGAQRGQHHCSLSVHGQRLERLSVAGRHLLHAAVSVEMWYGAAALRQVKVVMAVDCDCEYFVVNELQQWNFFGLHHSNVVVLPLPRFHGFAQDMRSGHLAHVKGSPRLMLGTGYAMFLLNSPAEAYTLSADASEPQCLQGSVLEWLQDAKASWLYTGLFSDLERLRPEALMRTVKSYKLLSSTAANPQGFYIATHRYAFSVKALQRMLVDPGAFHADVYLQGFYAYATFDISDLTTFRAANCACILATQGLRAPIMSEVIYGKDWLAAAATVLQLQTRIRELLEQAVDKELDFHQQLLRDVALRVNGASVTEVVAGLLGRVHANMLVIPSERLCPSGTSTDLGQLAGSSALALARAITSVPLLVVKANTIGKYLTMNPNGAGGPASASERASPSKPAVARASMGLARSESRAGLAVGATLRQHRLLLASPTCLEPLVALTGLHLMVVSYDQQSSYIEESTATAAAPSASAAAWS